MIFSLFCEKASTQSPALAQTWVQSEKCGLRGEEGNMAGVGAMTSFRLLALSLFHSVSVTHSSHISVLCRLLPPSPVSISSRVSLCWIQWWSTCSKPTQTLIVLIIRWKCLHSGSLPHQRKRCRVWTLDARGQYTLCLLWIWWALSYSKFLSRKKKKNKPIKCLLFCVRKGFCPTVKSLHLQMVHR